MIDDLTSNHGVVRSEAADQGLGELFLLRPHPALGQISEDLGVAFAGDERLDHRRRRLRPGSRCHRRQLDAGVLEELVEPLDLLGPGVDLGLAVSGQLPQLPDRGWRHEVRSDHPVGGDIGQPLGVGQVGLAARDSLHVVGVDQPHLLNDVFQAVVDRLPVHPGCLHHCRRHGVRRKPGTQLSDASGHRGERPLPRLDLLPVREAETRHHRVSVHIESRNPVSNPFHVMSFLSVI